MKALRFEIGRCWAVNEKKKKHFYIWTAIGRFHSAVHPASSVPSCFTSTCFGGEQRKPPRSRREYFGLSESETMKCNEAPSLGGFQQPGQSGLGLRKLLGHRQSSSRSGAAQNNGATWEIWSTLQAGSQHVHLLLVVNCWPDIEVSFHFRFRVPVPVEFWGAGARAKANKTVGCHALPESPAAAHR